MDIRIRRPLRAVVFAVIAGTLGLTLAVVPTGFTPEQSAQALCLSSISPQCNPGNIPILIEAGIIAAQPLGVPGSADGPPIKTSKTGLILELVGIGAAVLAALGFITLAQEIEDGYSIDPMLHEGGMGSMNIGTDPTFTTQPSSPILWGRAISGCIGWMGGTWLPPDNFAGPSCGPMPFTITDASGKSASLSYDVAAGRIYLTLIDEWWKTSTNSYTFAAQCSGGGPPPVGTSITINSRVTVGTVRSLQVHAPGDPGAPLLCSSGAPIDRMVGLGTFLEGATTTRVGSTLWSTLPAPSDRIQGVSTVSVDCKGPGGTETITASLPYNVAPGESFTTPEALCPPGTLAVGGGLTVDQGGNTVEVIPRELNDVLPLISDLVDDLPHCFGPAAVPCPMKLEVLDGSTWRDCGPVGSFCPEWAQVPSPQLEQTHRCLIGGVVVDLNYCSAFRAPAIGVLPNIGTNGQLLHPSAPAPNAGNLLNVTPPGGSPSPGAPPGWLDLGQDAEPTQCFPTGWGVLNPISWVLMPVGCALEAAFVPRQSVIDVQLNTMTAAWSTTPPAQLAGFFEGLQEDLPYLDGCSGPPVNIDLELNGYPLVYSGYPLSACQAPMSHAATVARTLGAAAMLWGCAVAISRYLGATLSMPQYGSSS